MIELPKHKMTADEFLLWLEEAPAEEGKFELWDGEVVTRDGGGFAEGEIAEHWDVKGAMYRALHEAVQRARLPCFVAVDGPMVRLSEHRMARPDVLVYCGPKVRRTREVSAPGILVEVLSPSTRRRDHGIKKDGYLALPSLWHYLIVDPDRACLIHHKRGAGDSCTEIVTGPRLLLEPPGLDLDLREVLAT